MFKTTSKKSIYKKTIPLTPLTMLTINPFGGAMRSEK